MGLIRLLKKIVTAVTSRFIKVRVKITNTDHVSSETVMAIDVIVFSLLAVLIIANLGLLLKLALIAYLVYEIIGFVESLA